MPSVRALGKRTTKLAAMTTEQIQNQIYTVGSIAFLKQVHDALVTIAKHDPLSAHLAAELEELIIYQEA